MATVTLLKRASSKGSLTNVSESADAAALSALERTTSGGALLWTDGNTTSITIGGGASQTSITIGKSGQDTNVLGDLRVDEVLFGPDDGTGVVVGKVGASANKGSTFQVASFTTAERDFLSAADGMVVYNSTEGQLQARVAGAWTSLLALEAPVIANGTSTITRNVTGFAVASGMTITPGAGDYVVFFGSYCQVSNNATDGDFQIFANGVAVAASLRTVHNRRSGDRVPFMCMAYVTGLAAGQAITGEWSRAAGGGTVTIRERQLLVVKVG